MASRVVLNGEGFRQLLTSPEIVADLEDRAERIAVAAGPGMEVGRVVRTGTRGRVTVYTATAEAREAEAVDRSLTRAIDAGR